jgi:hypothetical protein
MRVTAMKHDARSVIGMVGAAATAIALSLTLASTPAHAATISRTTATAASHAPKLTTAELKSLHKLVATKHGRVEFYSALRNSFGRVAGVGTGTPRGVVSSKPGMVKPELSAGFSGAGGEHFWIIASYAEILSGAITRATPYCVAALTPFIDPWAAAAVCGGIVYAINRMASGHSPLGNHGVWAQVHFWPYWTGVYAW